MKRIIFIFFILIGVYLLFNANILELLKFGDKSEEVSIMGVKLVDIDVSGARATIIPEKRNTIKAEISGKGKVIVEKSGKTIKVKYEQSSFSPFQFGSSPKLKIFLPKDYENNVSMRAGSGLVNFSGASKTRPMQLKKLEIELGSGNIELANLQTKEFTFNGGSGIININTLITQNGSIKISSGVVKVNHYQGKLDANVSSGLLHIQMDKLKDDVKIDVSSGQMKLDLPDNANFNLNSHIGSGLLKCDFPLVNRSQEKKKISGIHGTGEHNLKISVSSGIATIY